MGLNIGLLYLSLHNQLKKSVGMNKTLTRKELFTILGKHFLIPKPVRACIIRELELMKMVKRLDRDNIKLLDYNLDIERDVNKFYKTLKLFE
jgi:hypothetical protein